MKPIGLISAIGLLALASPAHSERFEPRNECVAVEDAEGFRMALATAVANRDEAMLQKLVDPEILLDFGGGSGWPTMRERLNSQDYQLWAELDKIIRLGCAMDEDSGMLALPWYWTQDLGLEDPFSTMLVVGFDVPLRQGRAPDSPLIDRISWEAVTLLDDWTDDPEALVHVQFPSGRKGYIAWKNLRSQVDYRLLVERGDAGAYRITTFVAGD